MADFYAARKKRQERSNRYKHAKGWAATSFNQNDDALFKTYDRFDVIPVKEGRRGKNDKYTGMGGGVWIRPKEEKETSASPMRLQN